MSLMMALKASSKPQMTIPQHSRGGSLVLARWTGNHPLSADENLRLQAETASLHQPKIRAGRLWRLGLLQHKLAGLGWPQVSSRSLKTGDAGREPVDVIVAANRTKFSLGEEPGDRDCAEYSPDDRSVVVRLVKQPGSTTVARE